MGGSFSQNSLVKKNEIVNWTFEKVSWLDVQFGLPDINLKGQVALRNQLESEKDISLNNIQKNTNNFLSEKQIIGTISSKRGNLSIVNAEYNEQENIIFTIKNDIGEEYFINLNRKSMFMFNRDGYFFFLQYAYTVLSGNAKLIISEECQKTGSLNRNCDKKIKLNKNRKRNRNRNRNSGISISFGGGEYQYITNPITNRKVKVDGYVGRQILQNYLKNLDN